MIKFLHTASSYLPRLGLVGPRSPRTFRSPHPSRAFTLVRTSRLFCRLPLRGPLVFPTGGHSSIVWATRYSVFNTELKDYEIHGK